MHDGHTEPIEVGPYRRFWDGVERISYWNGSFWGVMVDTIERAEKNKLVPSGFQDLPWNEL